MDGEGNSTLGTEEVDPIDQTKAAPNPVEPSASDRLGPEEPRRTLPRSGPSQEPGQHDHQGAHPSPGRAHGAAVIPFPGVTPRLPADGWLTTETAAFEIGGVTPRWVRLQIEHGRLRARVLLTGSRPTYRIRRRDLDAFCVRYVVDDAWVEATGEVRQEPD